MREILTAVEDPSVKAWQQFRSSLNGVRVLQGSILEVSCDVVFSPANSLDFMDGWIDALYLDQFGPEIPLCVRRAIYDYRHDEVVVGEAEIVKTGHRAIPYLKAAPTMSVPMILRETVNTYLAPRAALLLVLHGVFRDSMHRRQPVAEDVETVAFRGLGIGVGRLSATSRARQMRAALDNVFLGTYTMPRSWDEAHERHQVLYTDRLCRLHYEA